jgi:hypothetical protein
MPIKLYDAQYTQVTPGKGMDFSVPAMAKPFADSGADFNVVEPYYPAGMAPSGSDMRPYPVRASEGTMQVDPRGFGVKNTKPF